MPPTRVGFKKSRNGCVRCKARHVKCDEQRPCGNCKRHEAECSLAILPQSAGASPSQPSSHSATSRIPHTAIDDGAEQISSLPVRHTSERISLSGNESEYLRIPSSFRLASLPSPTRTNIDVVRMALQDLATGIDNLVENIQSPESPEWPTLQASAPASLSQEWMRDLQLFHHFSSSTYLTLAYDPSTHHIWREYVPRLASSYEFLMHALLAISGFHFGYINPEQRQSYTVTSTRHQTLALELFSSRLPDVNAENCQACILFASFIFIISTYSLAGLRTTEQSVAMSDVVQSFLLMQGVNTIFSVPSMWQTVKEGPLGPLLDTPIPAAEVTGEFATRLDELINRVRTFQSFSDPINAIKVRSSCFVATEALKSTYAMMTADRSAAVRIWSWPMVIPREFLDLISENHPAALAILAHYAVMVRCYESYWYLQGWSDNVFRAMKDELKGTWVDWIEWPLKYVRENIDVRDMARGEGP